MSDEVRQQMISGLWVGDELPLLARLCIKSFLDHGIAFRLFAYRPYDDVPEGTIICDAADMLPEQEIFRHHTGSYAPFADWFRYTLLEREGGFWADLDVACMGEALPDSMPYFAFQEPGLAAIGVLGFPRGHPVMTAMKKLARDPACPMPWDTPEEAAARQRLSMTFPDEAQRRIYSPWGATGPEAFSLVLRRNGLLDGAVPGSRLYPIHYTVWRYAYNGHFSLHSPELANAWAIHLWGEMLRREPDALENATRNSVVGQLLDRHLPDFGDGPQPEGRKRVKILVGICSCLSAGERRRAVRETWLSRPVPGIECLFFAGRRTPLPDEPDVVTLWADDSYGYLPEKGLAFYRYALKHYDFDWLFKCDDDTYLALDRLESLCDDRYGLIGDMSLQSRGFPSGGAGYLMTRRMVEHIVANGNDVPPTGPEDVIFGRMARDMGAALLATDRLVMDSSRVPSPGNDQVTAHWCGPDKLRIIDALFSETPPATTYEGRHRHWNDDLLFYANGAFKRRHSGDMGRFVLQGEQGLALKWADWPQEVLECRGDGYAMEGFEIRPAPGQRGLKAIAGLPGAAVPREPWSRKIHLGCGPNRLDGWLNLDLPNGDITKPLPWPDGSLEAIFLEHVIEHVPADAAYRFFEEARRVLQPGGVLRLAFPDLLKTARQATPEYLRFIQNHGWGDGTPASAVRNIVANHGHRAVWTEETMRLVLEASGFEVAVYPVGHSDTPGFCNLEHHQSQIGADFNAIETTCIEARPRL